MSDFYFLQKLTTSAAARSPDWIAFLSREGERRAKWSVAFLDHFLIVFFIIF